MKTLATCLCAGAMLLIVGVADAAQSELPNAQRLPTSITPVRAQRDTGPTTLLGIGQDPRGVLVESADFYIEGEDNYRVYFDLADNSNFHFIERRGANISLGLCEAGIEQLMATGVLEMIAPLRLARHGAHIGLFQKNKLILSAFDDSLRGGRAGFRLLAADPPIRLKVEPREDIHFSDDFMIAEGKGSQWRGNGDSKNGDFLVRSLRFPVTSANAFNYMGAGRNIYSVVGQPWWDHYCFEASLRGPATGCIGLVFAYQDDQNYALFRWSSRQNSGSKIMGKDMRELVRVRDGQEQVLARASGGYIPNQWYGAAIRITYAGAVVMIDGHILFDLADPYLMAGGTGVWCDVALPPVNGTHEDRNLMKNSLNAQMKQHAVFDDVRVNTVKGFEDKFKLNGSLAGGWLVGTGAWNVKPRENREGASSELTVISDNGPAKALIGERFWANYEAQTEVRSGGVAAGLVFLHRDESNYYAAILAGDVLKLIRVANGKEMITDQVNLLKTDTLVRLKATIRQGHIAVRANDTVSIETFDGDTALKGRAGLIVTPEDGGKKAVACFTNFQVSFPSQRNSLVTENVIFDHEDTMSAWADANAEWYPPNLKTLVDGKPVTLLWHRSQFPGDVELLVEPREIQKPNFEIDLSVSKNTSGKENGYIFRYQAGDKLELLRQGVKVVTKPLLANTAPLINLALRRCGRYLVGLINGRTAIVYRDDSPLVGGGVALRYNGVTLRHESTRITSQNFKDELFAQAPVDWRVAGAATITEITNRWQCSPRWSFFSLKNDRAVGKPAVLWNKALYPGDVSVEFFVGNKHEPERGEPYAYARDINVTICSDGADLTKGYTFMFGGFGNQGSMILRNGVEVKRNPRSIPTGHRDPDTNYNYHRHWFAVKVEKRGNRLSFRVDQFFNDEEKRELVFEDAQLLKGDRIAIWTYDHAIMLSRVRISGEGGNVFENPDEKIPPLKTPYDHEIKKEK
ncbi:MAG: hypothetical protein V1899_01660 [Planctomycetota bacterium]